MSSGYFTADELKLLSDNSSDTKFETTSAKHHHKEDTSTDGHKSTTSHKSRHPFKKTLARQTDAK